MKDDYIRARKLGEKAYKASAAKGEFPYIPALDDMLPDSAKTAMKNADIILAKGQGNYESLSGQGFHIFYSFLCKCERFTERFQAQKLSGIFVEEQRRRLSHDTAKCTSQVGAKGMERLRHYPVLWESEKAQLHCGGKPFGRYPRV